MKCLCGYEKVGYAWRTVKKAIKGQIIEKDNWINVDPKKEAFIEILGHFTIKEDDGHTKLVDIYACPKCGTIRMEKSV